MAPSKGLVVCNFCNDDLLVGGFWLVDKHIFNGGVITTKQFTPETDRMSLLRNSPFLMDQVGRGHGLDPKMDGQQDESFDLFEGLASYP